MVMPLHDKKTLFFGLLVTLGITILGGFIITSFVADNCRNVTC
ncbi:MAG: hypothetical protein ACE5SV_07185 [Candidatus Nitrosomaritimum aestuariumsis]